MTRISYETAKTLQRVLSNPEAIAELARMGFRVDEEELDRLLADAMDAQVAKWKK